MDYHQFNSSIKCHSISNNVIHYPQLSSLIIVSAGKNLVTIFLYSKTSTFVITLYVKVCLINISRELDYQQFIYTVDMTHKTHVSSLLYKIYTNDCTYSQNSWKLHFLVTIHTHT